MLENLKNEMERKNVKTKDLADLLNLQSSSISKRISGNVKFTNEEKEKVSRYLGINDHDYLFRNVSYARDNQQKSKETVFSKRFSELLSKDSRTQKQIAELLGVHERTIIDWKKGRQNTNTETLRKISKIFDVSVSYLSGESDYYPSAVNYLDSNMKDYRNVMRNLKCAVNDFLSFCNFDVKKLEELEKNKDISYSQFCDEHYDKYKEIKKIKEEIENYTVKLANEKGFKVNSSYDLSEEDYCEITKDNEYFASKYDEMCELEDQFDDDYSEYFTKFFERSERISNFYSGLGDVIIDYVREKLSDIIDENSIFDFQARNKEDNMLQLSYFHRELYSHKDLYNFIKNMTDKEFDDKYIRECGDKRHLFLSHRFGYILGINNEHVHGDNRKDILDYLKREIDKYEDNIKELEKRINR